jgi:hypothetical protein
MPGFCCRGSLTPHLFKRKKRLWMLFERLQKLCWVGMIRLSWACSSRWWSSCSAQAWKRCLVEYPLIHHQQRLERPVLLTQQELNRHYRASRSSLLHKAWGVNRSNLLYKALGVNQSNLLYKAWGVGQSSRLYKTIEVNPFNSRTHISLHMGTWRSVRLECHPIPLTR